MPEIRPTKETSPERRMSQCENQKLACPELTAMQLDASNTETDLLVYRDGVHPFFGLGVIAVTTGIALATLTSLVSQWPDGQSGYIAGLILCAFFFAMGLQMMVRRSLKLDRKRRVMTKSSTLLFIPISTKIIDTSPFNALKWKPRTSQDSIYYDICFSSASEAIVVFQDTTMLAAKNHTREIAEFFRLDQIHWDADLLTIPNASRTLRNLHFASGRKPWVMHSCNASRLEYTQRFEGFLIFAAYVMGFMGLFALIALVLGIQVKGLTNAPGIGISIGLLFLSVAIVFIFGKRGITFDSTNRTVSIWWGLGQPLWSRRFDLSQISKVAIEISVQEVAGTPCRLSEVILSGPNMRLVIFRAIYEDETASFAPMIADHLNISFENSTRPTSSVAKS